MTTENLSYLLVIPARFKSTRLPGKPLIDLDGKSMIQRTYERCLMACPAERVLVATDDPRIYEHCQDLGINVIMTSSSHNTGTDRLIEVASKIKADFYINVQGDEPVANPRDISLIIEAALSNRYAVVNGYCPIMDEDQFRLRSIPKCVMDSNDHLLYMSRAPIPATKDDRFMKGWRQVCIYGFTPAALEVFSRNPKKTKLEEIEDIEILRFLEAGVQVKMIPLSSESIAVDVPEDVGRVCEYIRRNNL